MKGFIPLLAVAMQGLVTAEALAQASGNLRPAAQNPSPMSEQTRKHERIANHNPPGIRITVAGVLPAPVAVFLRQRNLEEKQFDLLLHFHGATFLVEHAAANYGGPLVAASVNLGAGSSAYDKACADSTLFVALIDTIKNELATRLQRPVSFRRIVVSGFSAGYGAIRRILGFHKNYATIDAVLLLDGLHASYVPEGKALAEGGQVDRRGLESFIFLAKDAREKTSHKKFLLTHSEIFPGTYVSTTEAADFILEELALVRRPVLKWGPLGMQQLSLAREHHFEVQGFAGNTAPDHVDHLHALGQFLNRLMQL